MKDNSCGCRIPAPTFQYGYPFLQRKITERGKEKILNPVLEYVLPEYLILA